MPTVIELPGGNATLKTSEELSNREVKMLRRAARVVGLSVQHLKSLGLDDIQADEDDAEDDEATKAARQERTLAVLTGMTDEEDDNLDLFQRTCAAVRLVDWSLDLPRPTTPEDVDNLPRPIYEALTTKAADLDLNESFSKESYVEAEGPKDPEPPTQDSSV